MTATEKRIYFFRKISQLVEMAFIEDIQLMPIAFFMTAEEVNRYFKEGKSEVDGYIKIARHQVWLAIDFVIVKNGILIWERTPEYEWLGKIWKELTVGQGKWGGDWVKRDTIGKIIGGLNDIYHFELGET